MTAIAAQLADARAKLAPVAGANAALEARLLAAHAWRMSPEELVLHGQDTRDVAAFGCLIARRLNHEPVAQILGEKHFWRDVFAVSRDVLTPRADSETMIETLLRLRPDVLSPVRILDLGTGSGCLVLSALREYTTATAVAVDASEAALSIAAKNAAALGLDARVEMLHSDWCSKLVGRFDVILSNPPYIPTRDIATLDADVQAYEPHRALDGGADGLDCYRMLVQQLLQHANPIALLLFEVGMGQAEDVAAIGVAAGWQRIEITNDLAGIPRVVALQLNTL
jgi:release factor glutamine methyltransferase